MCSGYRKVLQRKMPLGSTYDVSCRSTYDVSLVKEPQDEELRSVVRSLMLSNTTKGSQCVEHWLAEQRE
jgi:hypothetical protein